MSGLNICWNMLRVKKCKLKQWKLRTHHHLFHHLLAINVSTHYYLSHAWWAVFSVFPNKYVSSGCDIFAIINLFSSTLISCAQDDSSVGSHFLSAFWKDDRGMNAPMLPLFPPPTGSGLLSSPVFYSQLPCQVYLTRLELCPLLWRTSALFKVSLGICTFFSHL